MMKKIGLFVIFFLCAETIFVSGQQLQLMAGFGKHELIDAKAYQTIGNKIKGGLMQFYTLNSQIEPLKRFWISVGIGYTRYQNLIYAETRLVNTFRLRYLSVPLSMQYEVFKNFKVLAGLQWNIRPTISYDSIFFFWKEKLYSPVRIYYYGLNYTFFNAVEVGVIQQRYMNTHLYVELEGYGANNLYKQKSWYAYVSYVYRFGRKSQPSKFPEENAGPEK
ncbi:MAG: hypothetical protein ACP5PS_03585 [Bacteroidales bacterium]